MEKFNLSPDLIARIKDAAEHANIDWKSIAARPATAEQFCEQVEAERLQEAIEDEERHYDEGQPTEYEEWQDYMGGDDWDHGQYDY